MKVVKDYPPNFEDICSAIPSVKEKKGVVFTYGDTIFNPDGGIIQDHLEHHEQVHERQQEAMGVENWWKEYLENPKFRLEQELEAYKEQYRFVDKEYGRGIAVQFVKEIAKDLSGAMYGYIMKYKEARKAIMK